MGLVLGNILRKSNDIAKKALDRNPQGTRGGVADHKRRERDHEEIATR